MIASVTNITKLVKKKKNHHWVTRVTLCFCFLFHDVAQVVMVYLAKYGDIKNMRE